MTDKNYWLFDGQSTYSLVAGAEERDRFVGLGWSEADEPTDGFVHVWRFGIAEPGRTPLAALREVYQPAGWVAGPPPGGSHPFADAPSSVDAAESKASPKPSKPAAGGVEKE